MVTKIRWNNDSPADPSLVDALLDDIGIDEDASDKQVKFAARKYALKLIADWPDGEPLLSMGELDIILGAYAGGYEQALVDMGKRKPDNPNTFKMKTVTIAKSDYGAKQGMVEDIHRVHKAVSKIGITYLSKDKEYTQALDHVFQAYEALEKLVKKYPLN